ncbi:MAG: alpha/beta fold hydrolase [Alphaproteobacteria bacterium]
MTDRIPLALLPGLLTDRALWAHQIEALADLAESRVADFTTQDTIAGMAHSVLAMMPECFALAGLSMGGYVAMEVMRQAPERVGLLALLDTKARLDTPAGTENRKAFMEEARTGAFKGVTRRALEMYVHPDRVEDPGLADAVLAMAARIGREVFLSQQAAILGRPDSLPGLSKIACPTLVLCGRQDGPTPVECHEEIAAAIPGAKLTVIEDCGHLTTMERPVEVGAALREWLGDWPAETA